MTLNIHGSFSVQKVKRLFVVWKGFNNIYTDDKHEGKFERDKQKRFLSHKNGEIRV